MLNKTYETILGLQEGIIERQDRIEELTTITRESNRVAVIHSQASINMAKQIANQERDIKMFRDDDEQRTSILRKLTADLEKEQDNNKNLTSQVSFLKGRIDSCSKDLTFADSQINDLTNDFEASQDKLATAIDEKTEAIRDLVTVSKQREAELKVMKLAIKLIHHYHGNYSPARSSKLEQELIEALKPATIKSVAEGSVDTMRCKSIIGLTCLHVGGQQCEAGKCMREPLKPCRNDRNINCPEPGTGRCDYGKCHEQDDLPF